MFTKKIIQNCFKQAQLYNFATQSLKKGQISQVIGAVVDVQF
jgi:hypothetical protein